MEEVPPPLFGFDGVCLAARDGYARLRDVDGEVPDGGVTVIVGPSGSGKSSLLRLCNRLEVATSGEVRYRGRLVTDLDPLELRREVAMLFQRPVPFPGTVRDNLATADPTADDERFAGLLERAGLDGSFLDRVADDLSGGEGQRMCLARALALEPRVLLADEPTSALDPEATKRIEGLARGLADDGVPAVWVTQDLDQIDRLADHVLVVMEGRVAHRGPPSTLRDTAPPAVAAFLRGHG